MANDRDAVTGLLVIKMAGLSYSLRKMARLIITGVLDEAVTAGKLQSHRCAGIEIASGERKSDRADFIFPEHGQLIMLAAGVPHPLTIWLMRGCGLRIQEALAVQKSCFRDGGRTLRVFEQAGRNGLGTMPLKHRKAGEFRDVPVPGYVWAMVKDLPDGYLFRDGERFPLYSSYPEGLHAQRSGCADPRGVHPPQPASRVRVGPAGAQRADRRCCAVARAPGYQRDVPHLRSPDSLGRRPGAQRP